MTHVSCATVKRRMSAFCDGELGLDRQIAIEAHVTSCEACRSEVELTREIGCALRASSHAMNHAMNDEGELELICATVLPRIRAERSNALLARVSGWFDDMQLVSIAAGCLAFTIVCALTLFGTMSNMVHGASANPDSLAGLVESLSRESPMRSPISAKSFVPPRVFSDAAVAAVVDQQGGEDAVFAFAARVSREGNLSAIEVLEPIGAPVEGRERAVDRMRGDLLAAASAARFEPARQGGAPVSTDMVWVLTHTTVRGDSQPDAEAPTSTTPAGRWPIGSADAPDVDPVVRAPRADILLSA